MPLFRKHCVFAVKNSSQDKGQYAGINNIHADGNKYINDVHLEGKNSIHTKHAVKNRDKEHANFLQLIAAHGWNQTHDHR